MQERKQTIAFVKHLAWSSHTEFNNLTRVLKFSEAYGSEWCYFVCWLSEHKDSRCNDNDISTKKYFFVDIDIRETIKDKTGTVISDEELDLQIEKVVKCLEWCGYGDYCAVVNSWNGVHIYYSGNERHIDPDVYRDGLTYIHDEFNECLQDTWFYCDPSCVNISRIARLPWSINLRAKEWYVIWPAEARILFFEERNSVLFDELETFAELYAETHKTEEKQYKEVRKLVETYQTRWDTNDIWKKINDIPAYEVAEDFLSARVQKTPWKHTRSFKDGKKNIGIYYYEPYNILVSNGTGRVSDSKRTYTTYEFVHDEMLWGDTVATKRFFEEKYWIDFGNKDTISQIPVIEWQKKKKWYLYPWEVFDDLDCLMSWELVIVCWDANVGKTTWVMDILQANDAKKIGFYINLEFDIKSVAQSKWLFAHDKRKRDLTDNLSSLSKDEWRDMEDYVEKYLSRFKYYNNHNWCTMEELIQVMSAKVLEWFEVFVVDTLSKITWFIDDRWVQQQAKIIETFQSFVQSTGAVVILLHHTNKNWEFAWSKAIKNRSNVFILMSRDDASWIPVTLFELTKDKYVSNVSVYAVYDKKTGKYGPVCEAKNSCNSE